MHSVQKEINRVKVRETLQQQGYHALDARWRRVRQEHIKVDPEETWSQLADARHARSDWQSVPDQTNHLKLPLVSGLPNDGATDPCFIAHDVLLHNPKIWRSTIKPQRGRSALVLRVIVWAIALLHERGCKRQVQKGVKELRKGCGPHHSRHKWEYLRRNCSGMPSEELNDSRVIFREDWGVQKHLRCVRREKQQRAHREQLAAVAHGDVIHEEVVQHRIHIKDHVVTMIEEELQHCREDETALPTDSSLVHLLHCGNDARNNGGIHKAQEIQDANGLHRGCLGVFLHPIEIRHHVLRTDAHGLVDALDNNFPLNLRQNAETVAHCDLSEALVQSEVPNRVQALYLLGRFGRSSV
mmetsp:Transcript_55941/g.149194  ORF Transcript_55941/g.149194 Transcript_55941/m.149194 type:complete len:355 (-) Transcript_55941:296-1360(-)